MRKAAIYARSSKDRSDVSIATQTHELTEIARARDLEVVQTFEDAVVSGATEDRPGFGLLAEAIRNKRRGWSVLLVYDSSRIARRRYIAQAFKHHCRKHDVVIQYAKVPQDIDPISELVLDSVFEAMDEVHSLMSRDKAIAGQQENVRRGWRAGGRAPVGYQLEQLPTGAVREGKAVTKSRLVLAPEAPKVAAYLKARAAGEPRPKALSASGFKGSKSSLVDLEWNALAYAGHTVYGRHYGKRTRGDKPKRRPREEWQIQRDTHPALISDGEAEAILEQLATSEVGRSISEGKRAASEAILSGLLVAPDGRFWRSAGKHYRLEGERNVNRQALEQAVLDKLQEDLTSDEFIAGMVEAAQKMETPDRTMPLRREMAKLRREQARAARLAVQTEDGGVWPGVVTERTAQIAALQQEIDQMRQGGEIEALVKGLTPAGMRELLEGIKDPARLLESLVERIVLDADLSGRIEYRAACGVSMASPRRSGRYATVYQTPFNFGRVSGLTIQSRR